MAALLGTLGALVLVLVVDLEVPHDRRRLLAPASHRQIAGGYGEHDREHEAGRVARDAPRQQDRRAHAGHQPADRRHALGLALLLEQRGIFDP